MPRNQRPSFLKRQKEQQRKAKAEQKRDARRARRRGNSVDEELNPEAEAMPENDEAAPEA
ncbi:MAG: hypothetical protein HY076_04250 [Candidatus Eisenbacteria bacterium]|uniref:Uncharacterized protein n=1 Tax=Eiseniibacteriota bacterium TaxID=2212470 RepID=A0A9D6QJP2_UNCEI|nr:hypothetical protein [Candidatus Eisenbacteria bacterium]